MTDAQPTLEEIDALYDQYVKALEGEHRGEFAAVSVNGSMVIAPMMTEALDRGADVLPGPNFIYKIGDRAAGRWLRLTEL